MAQDKRIPAPDRAALMSDDIAERIRPRLTRETDVIEPACGQGRLTMALCGSAGLWEAADGNAAVISRLRSLPHNERLRFTVQDPQSLPFEHSTFDAAVVSDTLLTLPKPETALRELRRVLRPGGILFAAVHVFGGVRTLRARTSEGRRVRHRFTAVEFIDLVESLGFAVERRVLIADDPAPVCYLEARSQK